jgi:FkbM family methyltransferase
VLTGYRARRFAQANASLDVEAVALDELFGRLQLGSIYQVSIDTEGFDSLVLEGMRGTIARRQVGLQGFEASQMG